MKRIRIGTGNFQFKLDLKLHHSNRSRFTNRKNLHWLLSSSSSSSSSISSFSLTPFTSRNSYSTSTVQSSINMNDSFVHDRIYLSSGILSRSQSTLRSKEIISMDNVIGWDRKEQIKYNLVEYKRAQCKERQGNEQIGNCRYFSTAPMKGISPSNIIEEVDQEEEDEDMGSMNDDEEEIEKESSSIISSAYGTGRRKASVARVWLRPSKLGNGDITINEKPFVEYFPRLSYREKVIEPFVLTNTLAKFDVFCRVHGGGHTGQAGAISLGIARALVNGVNEELYRPPLKEEKLLTRDARVVERKKSGQPKARKKDQWVKR